MDARSGESTDPRRLGVGSILVWACWLGLGSGAMELVLFLLKCRVLDPRNLNVSRHLTWMFPVSGLIVVGTAGLLLAIGSRAWSRLATPRLVLFVLMGLAFVGVLFRAPIYTIVCVFLAVVLAWQASGVVARQIRVIERRMRSAIALPVGVLGLTIVIGVGAAGARRDPVESAGSDRKNVILIVLDTVRGDRLGRSGADRDTTPNLDRLATRGVRFDRAFSTAPWTAPSHASLFTGRWPHELSIGWDKPLDRRHATLAETLGANGYTTAGFVANATYCSYETGLDRGFDHYEDYDVTFRGILLCSSLVERTLNFAHKHPAMIDGWGLDQSSTGDRKQAARINRDFLGWLDGQGPGHRPFFAFLNYYDAHHPYLAPDHDAVSAIGRKPETPRDYRLLKTWWERDKLGIDPADLELARDSYDRCIASLDDQLGRLFAELDRRGELDRSVVIVTSDHGEHLGEHELYGHGCSLYRAELHVPLLVVAPGLCPEGQTVDLPVSLRDVPATILDLVGLSGSSTIPGRSLARVWSGTPPGPDDLVRSEIQAPPDDDPNRGRSPAARGPMTSLIDRDYHYIRAGDGLEELYDLRRDPIDAVNLAGDSGMAAVLETFRARLRR